LHLGGATGIDFLGTLTYTRLPVTKDDCKNGGWMNLRTANGEPFRNQGQCVSYVNHVNHDD